VAHVARTPLQIVDEEIASTLSNSDMRPVPKLPTYEQRLVAFVDILGWQETTKRSANDLQLLAIMESIVVSVKTSARIEELMATDVQIAHFSDSLVISSRSDEQGQRNLISCLFGLSNGLLLKGYFMRQEAFLIRGGVVRGPMYHDGPVVFGPALVSAYDLQKFAVYPRVILQSELAQEWGRGIGNAKTWRKDADGFSFFD
jgi:hypothetical protein